MISAGFVDFRSTDGRVVHRRLDSGAGSADWVAAARAKSGRTQYGREQAAQQINADKYLRANQPVTGRTSYYK